MKFKIDENLWAVAREWDKYQHAPVAEFSKGLCAAFIDAGMIDNDVDNISRSVIDATGSRYVSDICAVLAEYLYNDVPHTIPGDVFDAFCKLTIIGDGNCPECGGPLQYVETEGHELHDGDYYTPNSWIVDNYVYKCAECGEIVKTEKEL